MTTRLTTMANLGLLALIGCVQAVESTDNTTGNARLGISNFVVAETDDLTTIRGLDADHNVVATVDLIHGRFALTGMFREEYETPEVVGRKLDIAVLGEKLVWETAGYTSTLQMPAPPPRKWALAELIEDPHVKPILARWQIGFRPTAGMLESEKGYTYDWFSGNNGGTDCSGQSTCGTARNMTINTCGGGASAIYAGKTTMDNPADPGTEMIKLAQCCPSGSGGQSNNWFAIKTCPFESDDSECGSGGSACKGCPGYPDDASWDCWTDQSSQTITYEYFAENPYPNWGQCFEPNSCDFDEDCDSYPYANCSGGTWCNCWQ